jgi:hypothetical protein
MVLEVKMVKNDVTTFNLEGDPTEESKKKGNVGVGAGMDQGGMTYNLTDVEEDKKFELIPKGKYQAVVDNLEFGESSGGNPMITVVYNLTDPEYENRKIYDYMVLGGDGAEFGKGKLKKFLLRVCPGTDISNFNPQTFADSAVAIGKACTLELKIQTQKKGEYKGEKRNQVADILPPDAMGSFM